MRRVLKTLFSLVLILVIVTLASAWVYRDIPQDQLEARYATADSRFVELDGVRVHHQVQGSGPALVLVHAHFASLFMWDPWVDVLQDHFRVYRFDMTSHGLTGVDASGDYSKERTVELLERFIHHFELDRVVLGGTSLGGTVSIEYAARHPERVDRLILISPGALNERVRGRQEPVRLPDWVKILTWITPRAFPKMILQRGYGDPERVPDDLVDRWHDFLLLEGQREAEWSRTNQYISGDVDTVIGQVRAPVLIMWGEANDTVPVSQAEELRDLLTSAPSVDVVTYPGIGHMAVQEAPEATARDATHWLLDPPRRE